MADENNGGSKSDLTRVLQTRPRHQRIDHAQSRQRADNAATQRPPKDVDDIRSRLKEALRREIEMKRLTEVFPASSKAQPVGEHPAALKVSPLPDAAPVPEKTVMPTPLAEAGHDDVPAKPHMNENGFQIFKRKRDEADVDDVAAMQDASDTDNEIPKTVDPVPMGADAIEEALRLINEDDQETRLEDDAETAESIGFIPANISPGTFGSASAHAAASDENTVTESIDDEQIINDILSQEEIAAEPLSTSPAPHSEPDDPSGPALHVVDPPKTSHEDIPAKDKIHNWQIGQAIASSIRGIVKEEVDVALDKLARQAVRDALSAYR